ncbi:MAG: acetylxylan esterase [Acidobacteria bacterium]|nr:acetylxylan esterase [Acidobacteriota bacterium]
MTRTTWFLFCACAASMSAQQRPPVPPQNAEYEALQAHFERRVNHRHEHLFDGVTTIAQWETRQKRTRAQLERMLWGNMQWPGAPPRATVTHTQDFAAYRLENIVLETAPSVFLTANLYLPRTGGPHPVVLYQCGHASKNYYARHGAWFASHGIAALVMDNIEMGEVEFTHHGVYSHAWFHWYSRGFSPLAAELLNARRAVDYLAVRRDLDPTRIGATGRSGGGMTTFFLAAIDPRIRASAPVSGTLSTHGWIKQRLGALHCDCQYPVNSYGLFYSEIGALIAPRVQLQCNADADTGFPMNTFNEMMSKMGEIYSLYKAPEALRASVTPGGHSDVEAIRLPVYSFFLDQFLGKRSPLTAEGPVEIPDNAALVCYRNGLPLNERLSRIDEELFPGTGARPKDAATLASTLREEVFRYFPAAGAEQPIEPQWGAETIAQGRRIRPVTFTAFEGLRVKATLSLPADGEARALPALVIADHRRGIPVWGNEQPLERNQWGRQAVLLVETVDRGSRVLERNLRSFADDDPVHHMRRQAMVAGTTIESMQVYELMRAVALLRTLPSVDAARIAVTGKAEMGISAMYAALLDGRVARVILHSPLASHRQGPHYLSVLRYTDVPGTAAVLAGKLSGYGEIPASLTAVVRKCAGAAACLAW